MTTDSVDMALRAAVAAWAHLCRDYDARLINSERCMQAALYHHIRKLLPRRDGYRIFIEAVVRVPANSAERIHVDTLVLQGDEILLILELKFAPRGFPSRAGLTKDLNSLSKVANRRAKKDRVSVEFTRNGAFTGEQSKGEPLKISQGAVRLLAFVCAKGGLEKFDGSSNGIWRSHRPEEGRWAGKRLPPKLGFLIAEATAAGNGELSTARPYKLLGKPFEHMMT